MKKVHEYLLIGNGRLASHLSFYFNNLNIDYLKWDRNSDLTLDKLILRSNKILLAISDNAIEPFIQKNRNLIQNKLIVHFSGSKSIDVAESAHPLMTFGDRLYERGFYKTIPFITEKGKKSFHQLFSKLPNPNFEINPADKPYYHAWCSIAGNFTTLLWKSFEDRIVNEINLPKKVMIPYLEKIMENLIKSNNPLTGPFAREDIGTVKIHKAALKDDLFLGIYNEFFNYYFKNLREDQAYREDS